MAEINETIKYLDLDGLREFKNLFDTKINTNNKTISDALTDLGDSIGDGKLTINVNNNRHEFTANLKSDTTIDITIPPEVSASSINNVVKYGLFDVSELTDEQKESLASAQAQFLDFLRRNELNTVLNGYGNKISYDSTTKYILLKHDNTVLDSFDASAFLVDGMISDVKIAKGTGANAGIDCLIFDFNTDSGITDIEIPLTSFLLNLSTVATTGSYNDLIDKPDLTTKADKTSTVSNVAYDTTNKKITKTINDTTSDVVTSEKIVEDGGGMNLVEGYYYNKKFYKEDAHTTEIMGAGGRIYIDKPTNREYRWDGTKYVLLKSEVDGSFVNEGTFTYRPTAGAIDVESKAVGEGGAQIECVKGNTIAWNQLVQNGDFSDGTALWYAENNLEFTVSNNIATLIYNGTTYQRLTQGNTILNKIILGHKYYTCVDIKAPANLLEFAIHFYGQTAQTEAVYADIWHKYSLIATAGDDAAHFLIASNQMLGISGTAQVRNVQLFDLTLIYGEGNEPTTVEQFEADYQKWFGKPLTYEEYDEGSLRSVEMTGIKSVGFNQYNSATGKANVVVGNEYQITGTYTSISENEEVITPDANGRFTPTTNEVTVVGGGNDTCIYLVHSGDRNGDYEPYWEHTANLSITSLKGKLNGEGESVVIFPDGMKKAGTVYDEIVKRGNQTVAIKRIGQVDLGTLLWVYDTVTYENIEYHMFVANLAQNNNLKGISSKYEFYTHSGTYSFTTTSPDKSMSICGFYFDGQVCVKDSSYTDVTTFKAAMDGVILYYELETPEEYIIDDIDFPTEYPVDDYGTEEILSDSAKSLAPTLDIRYGLNATDTLRNLPTKYVSAVVEQNFTEEQKTRARNNIGAVSEDINIVINALTRHTRLTDFDLNVLKQAVADGNLEKYGLKVGDQKTINYHTYVIAGLNPMKGIYEPYRVNKNHVGLIVIPHTTHSWNDSGNTYTGSNDRGAGYKNSDLHAYLKSNILPMCQTDLGSNNLIAHYKLLSSAVNTSGYNRFGTASGCSSSWDWESDCYISALSEVQVYGNIVWSSSGYDTGEACRQLDVFRVYNMNEIFGREYPWLRDVATASNACDVGGNGDAGLITASAAWYVAGLILFN